MPSEIRGALRANYEGPTIGVVFLECVSVDPDVRFPHMAERFGIGRVVNFKTLFRFAEHVAQAKENGSNEIFLAVVYLGRGPLSGTGLV